MQKSGPHAPSTRRRGFAAGLLLSLLLAAPLLSAGATPAAARKYSSIVVDAETGFVADDDEAFAEAAVRLLTNDALWRAQHLRALDLQRRWGWPQAAAAFEELLA